MRRSARWVLPKGDDSTATRLSDELNIQRLTASILAGRGYHTPETARQFLSPSLSSLHDPLLLLDMKAAVARVALAIERQELILLYGDYDVDGTTSIVILKIALELLKARVEFHVPHRLKEGYGMRSEVIEEAAARGVSVIISVDTGMRANQVVREARGAGIDVIVTDHHLGDGELPPAIAVLNPNRLDCLYPEKNLCGAGVTFKLIQALFDHSGLPEVRRSRLLDSFLKMVAIATIADVVPLTGENRLIVQRGLNGLRSVKNAGLRALIGVSGLEEGIPPSAHQVAFRLAPRINAAGRMASARDVIDLFLTDDETRARELVGQLDQWNRERQQAEAGIIEAILGQCAGTTIAESTAALVFAEPGWHLGVVGIVASRLVEQFSRPVFVLSDSSEDGFLSGSGRSIPPFHLLEALESMAELFHKFGGHRQAAGLTIRRERVDEFRERFHLFANERLTPDDMRPVFEVDAETCFPNLTGRAIGEVFALAPFGLGNAAPVLMARGAEVAGPVHMMGEGKHLRVALRQQGRLLFFKGWGFGDRAQLFEPGAKLDVLFTIEDDPRAKARGYDGWSLSLKDVREANEHG